MLPDVPLACPSTPAVDTWPVLSPERLAELAGMLGLTVAAPLAAAA